MYPAYLFKRICIKGACLLVGLSFSVAAFAQEGTYKKDNSNGSYCVVSFQKKGNHIKADVFAWWNSSNSQMGDYSGEGTLIGNTCVLHSAENDPVCKVTLSLVQGQLKAFFSKCDIDHLPTDFNGVYTKFTNATAGDYMVTIPKAYFYKKPDKSTQLKAYVLQGDKVTLDIDRIAACKGDWLYVYYTNKAGKDTAGYLPLSELKRVP